MSVYNNIRAALEVKLSDIENIPSIQFENTSFNPTTGTPFLTASLFPTSRRPSEVGSNPFNRYQGLFSISVATPENNGPKQNQDICNLILAAYPAGTQELEFGEQLVRIEYTEQLGSFRDSPWFITPINVGWYAYDKE
jgi:hypothetical protein